LWSTSTGREGEQTAGTRQEVQVGLSKTTNLEKKKQMGIATKCWGPKSLV